MFLFSSNTIDRGRNKTISNVEKRKLLGRTRERVREKEFEVKSETLTGDPSGSKIQ